MTAAPVALLTAVSAIILGGAFAAFLFRRWGVPEVPLLLLLGAVVGPLAHLVEPAAMERLLPIVGALAVAIIVFDGGLLLRPSGFRDSVAGGALLALAVLALTTIVVGLLGVGVLGLGPWPSVLLGLCLGGAGIVIIIPLIRSMGVSANAESVVTVEAVVSDLLVVLGVTALSAALTYGTAPAPATWVWLLLAGAAGGAVAGWLWARLLARHHGAVADYFTTLAVLLAVYATSERFGASGVVSILAFAVVLGNSRVRTRMRESTDYARGGARRPKDRLVPVFGGDVVHTHHDAVFAVRSFFFVGLGAVIDWSLLADPLMLLAGLMVGGLVAVARSVAAWAVLRGPAWTEWDRQGVGLMFPLGLVTAVTSVVPESYGVPGTGDLPELAALAILFTNALAGVLVFVRRRQRKPTDVDDAAPAPT